MKKLNWILAALALVAAIVPLMTGGLLIIYLLGGVSSGYFFVGLAGIGCWLLLLLLSSLLIVEKKSYHMVVWSILSIVDGFLLFQILGEKESFFEAHHIIQGYILIVFGIAFLSVVFFVSNTLDFIKRNECGKIYRSKLNQFRALGRHETKA